MKSTVNAFYFHGIVVCKQGRGFFSLLLWGLHSVMLRLTGECAYKSTLTNAENLVNSEKLN